MSDPEPTGSIAEKIFVPINGVDQGMFIKGRDVRNPVLLYVHGGMPDYFLTQKYPTGLEDYFTVVWWEQRGAGISYHSGMDPAQVTLEQLIADTHEVTRYLCKRFCREKIYLMGHSGGTFVGIQAAAQMPQLYVAYIGVAQISNQLRSEVIAYEYMLGRFKAAGNSKMVTKLEAAPVTMEGGIPPAYLALRDPAMHALGVGTMRRMRSVITGIFLPSLLFREYTFIEKVRMWSAKARSGVSVVWETILTTDLACTLTKLEIPVYFFHGIHDYTCSFALAESYLRALTAPVKGFYAFGQSAHSPIFEEPDAVRTIMREDVLQGTNRLAQIRCAND